MYHQALKKYIKDDYKIVYIDEMGLRLGALRDSFYAPSGIKLFKKKELVSSLTKRNVIGALINGEAMCLEVFKENVNANIFFNWFSNLTNKVKNLNNNKVIFILDNAKFHRIKQLNLFLENFNKNNSLNYKLLNLPSYCPHLNLIERFWSLLKREWKIQNPLNEKGILNQGLKITNEWINLNVISKLENYIKSFNGYIFTQSYYILNNKIVL